MSCKNKQHTEEIFRTLRALRLVDNDLMEACFKDNLEAADLLLKIILDRKDLTVTGVSTQYHIAGFQNHNVCLDIYATDIEGNKYNIEVQRANKGAEPQRARYYSSMIDTDMLMHGQDYDQLRENYVIFITENDVFRLNQPIYHIERIIQEGNVQFGDGEHIIYVNGAMRSKDTALSRLMNDFFCTDADDMFYKELADRVRYYKNSEEGVDHMYDVMEETLKKVEFQKACEIANNLIEVGKLSLEEIAACSGLTIEKVRELAGNKSA